MLAPLAWLLDRSSPETIGEPVDGDLAHDEQAARDRSGTCSSRRSSSSAARWRRSRVSTVAHVVMQAAAMGIAGGFVMVVFFSFWGRAYGRTYLGRIQGAAQAMTVIASAIGPVFLALWVEATGSYAAGFYALAAVVGTLAVAAMIVPIPAGVARRLGPAASG